MAIQEEWDRLFLNLMPVVSTGIGCLSLIIGVLALQRVGSPGRRAYHLDGQYMVSVRYPGQWHDIRQFIQPDNPDVLAIYSQIGPDVWACLDFVCRNIDYRRELGEFWQIPSETLRGYGDCEDSANLLTSLLRNFSNAYTTIGSYQGYGHAWTALNGFVYETTYTHARHVPDTEDYCPYVYFNDQEVIELWPGSLREMFQLRRNEVTKLNLMAEVLDGGSSNPGGYRYAQLPEACYCHTPGCNYAIDNPGVHCTALHCPHCGARLWREK